MQLKRSVITGTGSYIPTVVKTNEDFTVHNFYTDKNEPIGTSATEAAKKFREITGIEERRYAEENITASDMAISAAKNAIEDAGCDPETLDQIIVAQNFGNVIKHTIQTDILPAIASRVKHALNIHNPSCIPYDIIFGCPGWIQGVIQADAFFKAGIANKCLVIGTETLSRVLDFHDRDSMIFSDGAGACVLEAKESTEGGSGILATAAQAHCLNEVNYLYFGKSNYPGSDPRIRYIKMKGRKVYEYAIKNVPLAMKECLDKAGIGIRDLKKIIIHQANEKMDEAIIKVLYKLYDIDIVEKDIMPMNIRKLGNSSVATVPTLFDSIRKNQIQGHSLTTGDIILFASVGAGMNINAVCYRM
ncbi:MAG: ketoacyl-ACP synthase III [Ferruginibacter sp.]|nr:ketoacyl-ACP synthase III [Ferruginibacter sp.]